MAYFVFMKIIQLSNEDAQVLQAAFDACENADKAMKELKAAYYQLCDAYSKLLEQVAAKHSIQAAQASDDQQFIYGRLAVPPKLEELG